MKFIPVFRPVYINSLSKLFNQLYVYNLLVSSCPSMPGPTESASVPLRLQKARTQHDKTVKWPSPPPLLDLQCDIPALFGAPDLGCRISFKTCWPAKLGASVIQYGFRYSASLNHKRSPFQTRKALARRSSATAGTVNVPHRVIKGHKRCS
jgi:hypothetical protein